MKFSILGLLDLRRMRLLSLNICKCAHCNNSPLDRRMYVCKSPDGATSEVAAVWRHDGREMNLQHCRMPLNCRSWKEYPVTFLFHPDL